MKLQISFDIPEIEKAIEIAKEVADHCDVIEIGTILLYKYGQAAIERFHDALPDKALYVDTKIIERGKESALLFCSTKTAWISVVAGTYDEIIHAVSTATHSCSKKIMLDLIDSKSIGQSALDAQRLGADALLYHIPTGDSDLLAARERWDLVKGNTQLPIFIAGKITRDNFEEIRSYGAAGIVVGKAITESNNPQQEAQWFYGQCKV